MIYLTIFSLIGISFFSSWMMLGSLIGYSGMVPWTGEGDPPPKAMFVSFGFICFVVTYFLLIVAYNLSKGFLL